MTNKEKRLFRIAREVSLMSPFEGPRIGAIVVDGNRILSTGFNSNRTRPLQYKYNFYRNFEHYRDSISKEHAEISALSPLIGKEVKWKRVSIFIYREHRNGGKACSKPCPACDKLIHDLGIKNIYYIDKYGNYVKERVL